MLALEVFQRTQTNETVEVTWILDHETTISLTSSLWSIIKFFRPFSFSSFPKLLKNNRLETPRKFSRLKEDCLPRTEETPQPNSFGQRYCH